MIQVEAVSKRGFSQQLRSRVSQMPIYTRKLHFSRRSGLACTKNLHF